MKEAVLSYHAVIGDVKLRERRMKVLNGGENRVKNHVAKTPDTVVLGKASRFRIREAVEMIPIGPAINWEEISESRIIIRQESIEELQNLSTTPWCSGCKLKRHEEKKRRKAQAHDCAHNPRPTNHMIYESGDVGQTG